MRVLVTRPEPGLRRTIERLGELGHDPIPLPLFRASLQAGGIERLGYPSAIVATSANAFRALDHEPGLEPGTLATPVYVVGAATAAAARKLGFSNVVTGPGAGAGLAANLINDVRNGAIAPAPDRPLTYLTGIPRNPDLERSLEDAGMALNVLELYEMQEISYSTDFLIQHILQLPPEVVLLYSANAARCLGTLFEPETLSLRLVECRFLCLSPEIADALPKPWQVRASLSQRPDEASLLASLAALR